ncbi:YesL family protein [Pseudalkalibacillus hwajinpoensis]|uniref:YesL family protein n=1 Tax=Guptibacillus hwajinpoensis TaxID=208199 RepID=UPI001CD1D698|nr:DUF624 domain-containing protein [Pseudalkalibacillus hwajinpoensis]MCA0990699.1 DUF624 domain-containing protein [Pseudalkalibacillus hwajinpoensis]
MFGINGKASIFMKTITNSILLNLLWILGCLPIITIGHSTAAMINVIRIWKIDQEDSVFRNYLHSFRKYVKTGWIGTVWFLAGSVLVLDALFFLQMEGIIKVVLSSMTGLILIIFLLTTTFLFPILVHSGASGWDLIKKSFIRAFLDGSTSFGIVLIWLTLGTLIYVMPILIFVLVVPVSMITFRFCLLSFEKIGGMT